MFPDPPVIFLLNPANMKSKVYTVTIGIPAYNEEFSIENAIISMLNQTGDNFKLESIQIFLDGCTDNTEKIAIKLSKRNKIINVVSSAERKGKTFRLNQIYKSNRSDILITFDADIVLGNKKTVSEMVRVFQRDNKALLVAAHQIPIKPNTFVGKAIYAGYKVWDDTRLSVEKYDHIQNHYGAASALKKSFAKKLKFPEEITDDRGYLYIVAKKENGFRYTKSAYIYYQPVNTLRDFFKLRDRCFVKNKLALNKHFGSEVSSLYRIPSKYKYYSIVKNMISNPVFTVLGLLLDLLIRLVPTNDKLYNEGLWEISISTKKINLNSNI